MSRTSKFLIGRRRKDGRKSKVSGRKGTNKEYEIKKDRREERRPSWYLIKQLDSVSRHIWSTDTASFLLWN